MAALIRHELLALQEASTDGLLHAERVVEWARENPESALHRAIQWDDVKAADEYRLWQVRRLIALNVVSGDGAPLVVSLSIDRNDGGGYRSISDVAKSKPLMEIMLDDALRELERVKARYARVRALSDLWSKVDEALEQRRRESGGDENQAGGVVRRG